MAKDLLLEIGSEELPSSFVAPALAQLEELFVLKAREARLAHGEVRTYGTPRRLALLVSGLDDSQPDLDSEVRGPAAKAAFDAQGNPTKVAEKWAASQGVSVDQLGKLETPKGVYVSVRRHEKGQPAEAILPGLLLSLVQGLHFKKSMRWGWEEVTFARPVQWLCAVHGTAPVVFDYADVKSGNLTFGHRFLSKGPIAIARPADYLAVLEGAQVIADLGKRRELIGAEIAREASGAGGRILEDAALLDTVTNLVELPSAVLGSFDREYLDLPPEVLVSEARGHQKYFSVVDAGGTLQPYFVAVSNTPVKNKAVSRAGYERVLRARLSDARFFFTEDRKRPLASRVDELKRVVFQQKLGTSFEKMERFRALAVWLAGQLGLGAEVASAAEVDDARLQGLAAGEPRAQLTRDVARAAWLCKADLVTGMVGEFPELQGVMGREYAKADEAPRVALAILEHYLPRGASDGLPTEDAGALVGIADRLDTIVGIIGIGKGPTGAADPYGLRRACLAIINIVLARGYRFSLGAAIDQALERLGARVPDSTATRSEVLEFFRERLKNQWADAHRRDVVEAVLSAGFDDMVGAQERLLAMSAIVGQPDFDPLAAAFKRVVNILEKQAKDVASGTVDPSLFSEEAERGLFSAFASAKGHIESSVQERDYAAALKEITGLKPAVDRFFDSVRVLVEDERVKQNRVALLAAIGRLFGGIADFSKIQAGEQTRA